MQDIVDCLDEGWRLYILVDFLDGFETKYNSMMVTIQQPMFSCVTASEERLTNNINSIKELSTTSMSNQKSVLDELSLFLGKYNASSNKGKYGENRAGKHTSNAEATTGT